MSNRLFLRNQQTVPSYCEQRKGGGQINESKRPSCNRQFSKSGSAELGCEGSNLYQPHPNQWHAEIWPAIYCGRFTKGTRLCRFTSKRSGNRKMPWQNQGQIIGLSDG